MEQQKKLIVICLVGAPCSGKSTWVHNSLPILAKRHDANVIIVSRDTIRESLFTGKYDYNQTSEREVTKLFHSQLSRALSLDKAIIILDNTHMSDHYLASYAATFESMITSGKLEFYIEYFRIPHYVAIMRNITRRVKTGKWIPMNVLKEFYDRYGMVNVKKYPHYTAKYGII